MTTSFESRIAAYVSRVADQLEHALPAPETAPERLHAAMRYAVFNGGKRVRPLLVYATGECLSIPTSKLDPAATAIELIHAFSLVHDDLPAMDNDDLRRGLPTVHKKFDEATAILAADALQPLAFEVLACSTDLTAQQIVKVSAVVAHAGGSLGMTGGQSIDLASEGRRLGAPELETMHRLKTGALIEASVMSACCIGNDISEEQRSALQSFAESIGLAFQIRDDILDVVGSTEELGKQAGADQNLAKATWPALFGMEESIRRCDELLVSSINQLALFGDGAELLRSLAAYIVGRAR